MRPADLDGPEIPAWGEHLWGYWLELHQGRRVGESGSERIAYADLEAWARLCGVALRADEARMIMQIDAAYMAERAEIERQKR